MHALLSIYCKDQDQERDEGCWISSFFSHKVFTQLELWRNDLPDDITDDEVKEKWSIYRNLTESEMILA